MFSLITCGRLGPTWFIIVVWTVGDWSSCFGVWFKTLIPLKVYFIQISLVGIRMGPILFFLAGAYSLRWFFESFFGFSMVGIGIKMYWSKATTMFWFLF